MIKKKLNLFSCTELTRQPTTKFIFLQNSFWEACWLDSLSIDFCKYKELIIESFQKFHVGEVSWKIYCTNFTFIYLSSDLTYFNFL